MPDPGGLKPARLFIGLWPDPDLRGRLAGEAARLHKVLGGRATRPDTLHLTLVFIGELDRVRLPELRAALSRVERPRFDVVFDQTRCWRHNRIGYLAPSRPPAALMALARGLESLLDDLGIPFDRRPYRPHVTLIRKGDCPKGIPAQGRDSVPPGSGGEGPITWSAKSFVLVESVLSQDGARYSIIDEFPLS